MITLNDYLYNGDTVLRILQKYHRDLEKDALEKHNELDLVHCEMLEGMIDVLEHNYFLKSQSQRIRELYTEMTVQYPFLAFTFKGRIKSLIRAESKLNGYILSFIKDYHEKHGEFPSINLLSRKLHAFRDLIAYRIVISMPRCHLAPGENREESELKYLYQIANLLPEFLEKRSFRIVKDQMEDISSSPILNNELRPYYQDYIEHPRKSGYRSLHITLFDELSESYLEIQLRTKEMDDFSEIGEANHLEYEKKQKNERSRSDLAYLMENPYYRDAYERVNLLNDLDLSKVDVNMFGAINNNLVNDGCGFFKGRLILPLEHLSRFQSDEFI
ncbi:MAG: guanosine polyphosphate pyrophosphohydrolase [Firmicutes bacterium]|nr:guanosine polyphosphate pyrophosphohydrolase [Bacillota bacterium]